MSSMKFFLMILLGVMPRMVFAAACPNASQEPKLTLRTKSALRLMVCGYEEKEKSVPRGRQQMNEFQVYWQKDQEPPTEIFSASAQETYWVSVKKDKLMLEELWSVNGQWTPALSYEVSCTRKECQPGLPVCALKLPKVNFPGAMKDLQARVQMKDRGPSPELETLLSQAFVQALKGDKEAQEFFTQGLRPSRLDGGLGETWESAKVKIEKAKKLKCI